jgi:hypothetical protein
MEKHQPPRKHCWECLRRRLVCDSTRPSCRRCCATGTPCPGYDEATRPSGRPIRWLEPGRVTSRGGSRDRRLKGGGRFDDGIENPKEHDAKSLTILTKPTTTELSCRESSHRTFTPRAELRTDMCALIEAVEYCK